MKSYKEMATKYANANCVCQDGGWSDAGYEIVAAGANCDHMITVNHPQMRESLWDLAYGQDSDYTSGVYAQAYEDLFGEEF